MERSWIYNKRSTKLLLLLAFHSPLLSLVSERLTSQLWSSWMRIRSLCGPISSAHISHEILFNSSHSMNTGTIVSYSPEKCSKKSQNRWPHISKARTSSQTHPALKSELLSLRRRSCSSQILSSTPWELISSINWLRKAGTSAKSTISLIIRGWASTISILSPDNSTKPIHLFKIL